MKSRTDTIAVAVALLAMLWLAGPAGAETATLVFTGQAAPGAGGGLVQDAYIPVLNSSGQVAVWTTLTGTTDGSTQGIFRADAGGLTPIARDQTSAPGSGGGQFDELGYYPALNISGQVTFISTLTGTADGSTQGAFRNDGVGGLFELARDQQPAPGPGGGVVEALAPSR